MPVLVLGVVGGQEVYESVPGPKKCLIDVPDKSYPYETQQYAGHHVTDCKVAFTVPKEDRDENDQGQYRIPSEGLALNLGPQE